MSGQPKKKLSTRLKKREKREYLVAFREKGEMPFFSAEETNRFIIKLERYEKESARGGRYRMRRTEVAKKI